MIRNNLGPTKAVFFGIAAGMTLFVSANAVLADEESCAVPTYATQVNPNCWDKPTVVINDPGQGTPPCALR